IGARRIGAPTVALPNDMHVVLGINSERRRGLAVGGGGHGFFGPGPAIVVGVSVVDVVSGAVAIDDVEAAVAAAREGSLVRLRRADRVRRPAHEIAGQGYRAGGNGGRVIVNAAP